MSMLENNDPKHNFDYDFSAINTRLAAGDAVPYTEIKDLLDKLVDQNAILDYNSSFAFVQRHLQDFSEAEAIDFFNTCTRGIESSISEYESDTWQTLYSLQAGARDFYPWQAETTDFVAAMKESALVARRLGDLAEEKLAQTDIVNPDYWQEVDRLMSITCAFLGRGLNEDDFSDSSLPNAVSSDPTVDLDYNEYEVTVDLVSIAGNYRKRMQEVDYHRGAEQFTERRRAALARIAYLMLKEAAEVFGIEEMVADISMPSEDNVMKIKCTADARRTLRAVFFITGITKAEHLQNG